MDTDPPEEKLNLTSQNGKFINRTSGDRIPELSGNNVKKCIENTGLANKFLNLFLVRKGEKKKILFSYFFLFGFNI